MMFTDDECATYFDAGPSILPKNRSRLLSKALSCHKDQRSGEIFRTGAFRGWTCDCVWKSQFMVGSDGFDLSRGATHGQSAALCSDGCSCSRAISSFEASRHLWSRDELSSWSGDLFENQRSNPGVGRSCMDNTAGTLR